MNMNISFHSILTTSDHKGTLLSLLGTKTNTKRNSNCTPKSTACKVEGGQASKSNRSRKVSSVCLLAQQLFRPATGVSEPGVIRRNATCQTSAHEPRKQNQPTNQHGTQSFAHFCERRVTNWGVGRKKQTNDEFGIWQLSSRPIPHVWGHRRWRSAHKILHNCTFIAHSGRTVCVCLRCCPRGKIREVSRKTRFSRGLGQARALRNEYARCADSKVGVEFMFYRIQTPMQVKSSKGIFSPSFFVLAQPANDGATCSR